VRLTDYLGLLGVLAIAGYTLIYAWDAWQAGNRAGGLALCALTAGTTILAAYLLLFR
jgi:hypothetical protein